MEGRRRVSPFTGMARTPVLPLAATLLLAAACAAGESPSESSSGPDALGDTGYDTDAESRFLVYRGVGGEYISPNDSTNPWDLPIYLAQTGDTASVFESKINTAESNKQWFILLVHTIQPTTAVWYNPVNITDVTGAMTYAKNLGDVWVDTTVAIGAYWRAQKLLSTTTPSSSGGSMTYSWTLPAHFPPGKYLRITVTGGTVSQNGQAIAWNGHGYYEISLDAGSVVVSP
jgi:hypothetical protein